MADTVFDVIAVGDMTEDIFLQMHDASVQCDLDGHNCRICFDYAEKIAVDQKTVVAAVGNAANNAVGVARLGLKSALYSVVGDDEQGHKMAEILQQEGVDTRYIMFDKEHGSNLSVVINYRGERTIFVYHEPRRYLLPKFESTRWMYLTSASKEGLEALHQQVDEYLNANTAVKLAFNPGTHQIHLGLDGLKNLLKRTSVLFLNREEAAKVLGVKTRDIKELVSGFHQAGVTTMVLTDGPAGAYVSEGSNILFQPIFPGPVIERTGTGDAYGSGFLSAIIKGKDVAHAMSWGNANAMNKVKYIGARHGLLTPPELERIIKENSSIKVVPYGETGN